jgi:hypothetical protein
MVYYHTAHNPSGLPPFLGASPCALKDETTCLRLEYGPHIYRCCQRIREQDPASLHVRVRSHLVVFENSLQTKQNCVSCLLFHAFNSVRRVGLHDTRQALNQLQFTQTEQYLMHVLPIVFEYLLEVELLYFSFRVEIPLGDEW